MIELTKDEKTVTRWLLDLLKNGTQTVTYSDITDYLQRQTGGYYSPHVGHGGVPELIGNISCKAHELGLPLLSTMVVNKETRSFGDGLLNLVQILKDQTGREPDLDYIGQKDWAPLENYIGSTAAGSDNFDATPPSAPKVKPIHTIDPKKTQLERDYDEKENDQISTLLDDDTATPPPPSTVIPEPVPEQIETPQGKTHKRDITKAKIALKSANHLCEVDPAHPTFIKKYGGQNYTEAHHLIPMGAQPYFDHSLDVTANIISLCSNCHNLLHYGADSEKALRKLYDDRAELLEQAGIPVSFDQLQAYYV